MAPVKTIGKGISLAGAAGKDVYVSKGTYPEAVVMVAGVNMYGGYDAAKKWARALRNQPELPVDAKAKQQGAVAQV